MKTFITTRFAGIHVGKSVESVVVLSLPKGVSVQENKPPSGMSSDRDWMFVRREFTTGWMETTALETGGAIAMPPLNERFFVRRAVQIQTEVNSTLAERTYPVDAHFLIAMAWLESNVKNEDDIEGLWGPFQYSEEEWAASNLPADQISNPLAQLQFAAVRMVEHGKAVAELHAKSGLSSASDPFIPDYVTLLWAHMLGSPAAFACWQVREGKAADRSIEDVLSSLGTPPEQTMSILERETRWVRSTTEGAILSASQFASQTETTLNGAFPKALELLRTNHPDSLPRPGGTAPWFATARALIGINEASDTSQIRTFFKGTGIDAASGDLPHWCGAFINHCLRQHGDEIAGSIVDGPARASHWRSWGDTELNLGSEIPQGAIVVLSPGADTGTSGHVGFFSSKTDEEIELLGGNQTDSVRVSSYKIGRVVAIRWKDFAPPIVSATAKYNEMKVPGGRADMARLIVSRFAEAGFGEVQQIAALANAIGESGLDPERHNTTGEDSVGLFQCKRNGGEGSGFSVEELKNPETNIRIIIRRAQKGTALRNAKTIDDAVEEFVRFVQRPSNPASDVEKRTMIARNLLAP